METDNLKTFFFLPILPNVHYSNFLGGPSSSSPLLPSRVCNFPLAGGGLEVLLFLQIELDPLSKFSETPPLLHYSLPSRPRSSYALFCPPFPLRVTA